MQVVNLIIKVSSKIVADDSKIIFKLFFRESAWSPRQIVHTKFQELFSRKSNVKYISKSRLLQLCLSLKCCHVFQLLSR